MDATRDVLNNTVVLTITDIWGQQEDLFWSTKGTVKGYVTGNTTDCAAAGVSDDAE